MAFLDDPIGFMGTNVLLVGSVADQSGLARAKITERSTGVYKLEAGTGSGSFPIYWCHYKADDVHRVTVADAADFMFTPRMNGCSFAVGIPAADGAVTVAHANVRDNPTSEALKNVDRALGATPLPTMEETIRLQTLRRQLVMAEQKEKLETTLGGDQFTGYLSSTTYQSAELTTFGVRDTGSSAWSFHFQARSGNSQGQVIGCFRMQGRTPSTKK